MENQKQKNQSSYFTDSISEISGKLVEQNAIGWFWQPFYSENW